jgi:uncharacterized protein YgiM (DUF1202 family)
MTMTRNHLWKAVLLLPVLGLAACSSNSDGLEITVAALNTTVAEQAREISTLEAVASQPPPLPALTATRLEPQHPTVNVPSPAPVLTMKRPPTATPSPLPSATATATATATPIPDAAVGETLTNLRSGPGVGFEILAEIEAGTPLDVLGKSADGEWVKVRTREEQEGWMFYLPLNLNIPLSSVPIVGE